MTSKQLDNIMGRAMSTSTRAKTIAPEPQDKPKLVEVQKAAKAPSEAPKKVKKVKSEAVKEKEVGLTAIVPASVKRSFELMAVEKGLTKRSLLLEALQKIGISVPESELGDRRAK